MVWANGVNRKKREEIKDMFMNHGRIEGKLEKEGRGGSDEKTKENEERGTSS